MFVTEALISNEWTALNDLVTDLEANAFYLILNSSKDTIYATESQSTPALDVVGIPLEPTMYINYVKGNQNLYLRNDIKPSSDGSVKPSRITIHKKG